MTLQSPRIYTYKITFEEVSYYYYGSKKEKRYNEEYWGSPVTNKWCWELYTPKKQILEIFDYTENGYEECRKVEDRLIKSVLNDPWCLNEGYSGSYSLKSRSKAGKVGGNVNAKNKTGVCGLTLDERKTIGKRIGWIGGTKTYEMRVGIHGRTKEQMKVDAAINGRKGGLRAKELNVGYSSIPTEKRIEYGKIGGKISSSQKWKCLTTGYISTAAGLSNYQKARGIDTIKRVRIE